jgi:hypothetical protein
MSNKNKSAKTKQAAFILLLTLCICTALSVENQVAKAQDDSYLTISAPAENATYLVGFPLNLSISGQWFTGCKADISVSYSLDGQEKLQVPAQLTYAPLLVDITYANETTVVGPSSLFFYLVLNQTVPLPALQTGEHSITVYSTIIFHGTKAYTVDYQSAVSFAVSDPKPTMPLDKKQQPLNSTEIIAEITVAATVITASSVLVYHFKTSKTNLNKKNKHN